MSRDITVAMANAVSAATVRPVIIFRADYASGAVRLHSGLGNLTYNSETYLGVGSLGTVADIEETTDESSNNATFTLSASSAIIAQALTEPGRGRAVKMWMGALDVAAGTLIADPVLDYSGFISHSTHQDDGKTGSVTLHCVDETGDQERPLEDRYTDEDQRRIDPTDDGLEYVVDLPNKEFNWGNANVRVTQVGTPGGGSVDYPGE